MYVYVRLEHCSIFEYASKVGVLVLFLEGKEKCFFASSSANTRPIAKPMILIDRGWKAESEYGSNFQFGSLYAEIMTLQVHCDLT